MSELRRVFVDTSAWLALAVRTDQNHKAAVELHRDLGSAVRRVTSWGVVSETYTWLRYHKGFRQAQTWLQEEAALKEEGTLEVVFPTPGMETGIRRMLSRFADQQLSYVDASSLQVMESRPDIDAIFAFDHHLGLAGALVLSGPLGG